MEHAIRSLSLAFVVVLLLSLPACGSGTQETREADSTLIAQTPGPSDLVASWVEMWNSYDLDQVPGLFLTDDRVSYVSSEFEGAIRGYEAVVEHHRGFGFVPGGVEKGTRLWVEDLSEARFGETAVLTAIWYFQRDDAGGATSLQPPQRGPVTFVCVLQGNQWRFAHMNFGNYLDSEAE